MKKTFRITAIIIVCLSLSFLSFVYFSTYHPNDHQREDVICIAPAQQLTAGQSLKLLSWNIQFLAGNQNNHFFFDGGNDPWPTAATIDRTLKAVAQILIEENADIILLQEVDDGSARTYHRDQLADLLALLPKSYTCHTSAFYWKAWFIPHPAIMGSAGMKLSVISKYKISGATRHALSLNMSNNILMRQFNPKRAMLEALLPVSNGRFLHAINTHLSAFARGSNTMINQVTEVDRVLSDISTSGNAGFIAGDFNLIPPGEAFQRLSAYNKQYFNPSGTELDLLFHRYKSAPTLSDLNGTEYVRWYTNMATNADPKVPDKTIDYMFFSAFLYADSQYVRAKDTLPLSDHLPLIVYITLPE